MQRANRRRNPCLRSGIAAPCMSPRPPRLRVMGSPELSRGGAENAEGGSVFPGVLDAKGESVKETQISSLHHFSRSTAWRSWLKQHQAFGPGLSESQRLRTTFSATTTLPRSTSFTTGSLNSLYHFWGALHHAEPRRTRRNTRGQGSRFANRGFLRRFDL
jgi:hypothetical protein